MALVTECFHCGKRLRRFLTLIRYPGGNRAGVQGMSPLQVFITVHTLIRYILTVHLYLEEIIRWIWGHLGLFSAEVDDRAFDV